MLVFKESQNEDAKVISIISPTKKVGKTYMSFNLAKTLNEFNKKVIMIDMDYRRGDLHKITNQRRTRLGSFLEKPVMERYKIKDGFYSVPRPKNEKNAFNIMQSLEFKEWLDIAKKEYDYIIFDTPPILSVSESLYLAKISDMNLLTVSHNLTTKFAIKDSLKAFSKVGVSIKYIIYNNIVLS